MAYAKYYLYKEEESDDFGRTYHNTGALITSGPPIGIYDTLEECGGYITREVETDECKGYDKYSVTYYQISYDDGETWETISSAETLVEENSEDCGYIEPQYRTVSGDSYCNGYDEYVDVYSQVSYDSGVTWETITTTHNLIEECSVDCGCYKILMYGINGDDSISGAVKCNSSNTISFSEVNSIAGNGITTSLSGYQHVIINGDCCHSIGKEAFCTQNQFQFSRGTIQDFENFDKVTSIGEYGMAFLTGLTSIDISNVTSIGANAFARCCSLSSITINDSVTNIYAGTFSRCSGLTSITIPDSVTSIGDNAFRDCFSMETINFGINSQLTYIGDHAFSGCGLTSVTIPSGVTEIKEFTFNSCSGLTSAVLPSTTSKIYYESFTNCQNLESITINAEYPPTLVGKSSSKPGSFFSANVIYVPANSVNTYKNVGGIWARYSSKIQAIPDS